MKNVVILHGTGEPKLVQINTDDGLTLPGLLYESPSSKKAMIHIHGNGSNSIAFSVP